MQSKWKFTWGGPIPRQQIVAQFVCCPKRCRIWNLIKYFFSIVQCNTPPCNLCQMLCLIRQSGSLLSLSLVAVLRVLLAIPLYSITPMCSYNCKIAMLINVVRQVAVKIAQCKEKGNSKNKGSFSHASVVIWSFLFQYLQQSLGVCAKPVFHSLTFFFQYQTFRPLALWIFSRSFCSAATKAALRPFYFAVHPDLFGQHPQQRVSKTTPH